MKCRTNPDRLKIMKFLRRQTWILFLFGFATSGFGYVTIEFPGWEELARISPYVIIVRCTSSPESPRLINGIMSHNPLLVGTSGGLTLSDVKMVATLKPQISHPAATSSSPRESAAILKAGTPLTLWSEYWPCQGEDYLLFVSEFRSTNFDALDLYRVFPLGHSFDTNLLSGKSLNEQVKFMLQYRQSGAYNFKSRTMSESGGEDQSPQQRLAQSARKILRLTDM